MGNKRKIEDMEWVKARESAGSNDRSTIQAWLDSKKSGDEIYMGERRTMGNKRKVEEYMEWVKARESAGSNDRLTIQAWLDSKKSGDEISMGDRNASGDVQQGKSKERKKRARRKDWQRQQRKCKKLPQTTDVSDKKDEEECIAEQYNLLCQQYIVSETNEEHPNNMAMAKVASEAVYEGTETRRAIHDELRKDAPNMHARNIASIDDPALRNEVKDIQKREDKFDQDAYVVAFNERRNRKYTKTPLFECDNDDDTEYEYEYESDENDEGGREVDNRKSEA